MNICKLDTDKFLVTWVEYHSESGTWYDRMTGRVGIVTDGADRDITWGDPVTIAQEDENSYYVVCGRTATDTAVAIYEFYDSDVGDYCTRIVKLSATGTTLNVDGSYLMNDGGAYDAYYGSICEITTDKALWATIEYNSDGHYAMIISTVSYTPYPEDSYSIGDPDAYSHYGCEVCTLDSGRVFACSCTRYSSPYPTGATQYNLLCQILTINGDDSITAGDYVYVNDASGYQAFDCCKFATDKVLIIYRDRLTPYLGNYIIATISGTTVSLSSPTSFDDQRTGDMCCVSPEDNVALVFYNYDYGTEQGHCLTLEFENDGSIASSNITTWTTNEPQDIQAAALSSRPEQEEGNVVVAYTDRDDDYAVKVMLTYDNKMSVIVPAAELSLIPVYPQFKNCEMIRHLESAVISVNAHAQPIFVTIDYPAILSLSLQDIEMARYRSVSENFLTLIPHAPTYTPGYKVNGELELVFNIEGGGTLQIVNSINDTLYSDIDIVNHLTEEITSTLNLIFSIIEDMDISGTLIIRNRLLDDGGGLTIGGGYSEGESEVTEITTPSGSSISGGDYFNISSPETDYYVWFTVDGVGGDPDIPNAVGVQVDINSSDSADDVAQAVSDALDALDDFESEASVDVATVTNTGIGYVPNPSDGSVPSGVSFNVTVDGALYGVDVPGGFYYDKTYTG